ncbi:NAD(P)H-dependent oxidoreductase subunit E [Curvibacter sp. CHRR-16]|uniref:(2Fe-2S) ferredoxin domain-containing protein n=1 Tax=Curvibacter sp. CHRR-16 TaxID=2835872 RepID=UPI001BD9E1C2|nr:NAD(P)H-dependent oxidoreductase subunit E [Curvibacter sp. CHRR-16]MBT0571333.1 NAD(P)H-dependent oxidoreductase subunit E [Curvibacter sp. CHRR-16]
MSETSSPSVNTTAPAPAEVVKPKIGSYRRHLLICTGPRCTQDGQSQALFDSLGPKFKAAGLDAGDLRVKRSRVGCFAACKGGPIVCVQPDGTWYYNVTEANMDRIIHNHLVHGEVVADLVFHQGPDGSGESGKSCGDAA